VLWNNNLGNMHALKQIYGACQKFAFCRELFYSMMKRRRAGMVVVVGVDVGEHDPAAAERRIKLVAHPDVVGDDVRLVRGRERQGRRWPGWSTLTSDRASARARRPAADKRVFLCLGTGGGIVRRSD
jgi:hypothetical protein